MMSRKFAFQLAQVRRLLIAGSEAWRSTFNKHLIELARAHRITVTDDANLFGIAVQSAVKAGAHRGEAEDVAAESISRLVSRKPERPDWGAMAQDYISRTILPSIITTLQKSRKHLNLADLKRDSRVKAILESFPGISDKMLTHRLENPKPNKVLKSIETLGDARGRSSIFEEADPKKPFQPFWAKSTFHEAVDILRERNRVRDLVTKAIRFKLDDSEDLGGIDPDRTPELSVEDVSTHEKKSLLVAFRRSLDQIDPRYRKIIRLISEQELDPTNPRHRRKFELALGLTHEAFNALTVKFVADLKRIFRSLDVSFDEGSHLLKSAKLRRWMVQTRIFCEIHGKSSLAHIY